MVTFRSPVVEIYDWNFVGLAERMLVVVSIALVLVVGSEVEGLNVNGFAVVDTIETSRVGSAMVGRTIVGLGVRGCWTCRSWILGNRSKCSWIVCSWAGGSSHCQQ